MVEKEEKEDKTMLDTSVLEINFFIVLCFNLFRGYDIWQTAIIFQEVKYLTGRTSSK